MIKVDALGKECPIPVIETKKAIKALTAPDTIEVWVDNTIAVENLKNLAEENNYKVSSEKIAEKQYKIIIEVDKLKDVNSNESCNCCSGNCEGNTVIAIGSETMGCGDEKLGKNLIKAFIYAVSQAEVKPKTMIFYNGGAHITCEGSLSLEDLNNLKAQGVKIITCGTCLDFYGLKEKLKVGEVSNMYDIVSTMEAASLVIKP